MKTGMRHLFYNYPLGSGSSEILGMIHASTLVGSQVKLPWYMALT